METGLLITGTAICGTVIGIAGFVIGNNRNETRARGRIYERLDETKTEIENNFMRKELCQERNTRLLEEIKEVKCDVKKLLEIRGIG